MTPAREESSVQKHTATPPLFAHTDPHKKDEKIANYPHLAQTFDDVVSSFGPNDFFVLQKSLKVCDLCIHVKLDKIALSEIFNIDFILRSQSKKENDLYIYLNWRCIDIQVFVNLVTLKICLDHDVRGFSFAIHYIVYIELRNIWKCKIKASFGKSKSVMRGWCL